MQLDYGVPVHISSFSKSAVLTHGESKFSFDYRENNKFAKIITKPVGFG